MEIKIQPHDQKPQLAIMTLVGDLDGSNYQDAINAARAARAKGIQYLLIDMTDVPFMGSSGLVALHSMTLTMQDKALPNPEDGWGAFHAISSDAEAGLQDHVKISESTTFGGAHPRKVGDEPFHRHFYGS